MVDLKENKLIECEQCFKEFKKKELLLKYGEIRIEGEITIEKGDEILDSIRYLEKIYKKNRKRNIINVGINSNGGDILTGLNIYEELSMAGRYMYISTRNYGHAGGIAGIIFLAGKERLMMEYDDSCNTRTRIL